LQKLDPIIAKLEELGSVKLPSEGRLENAFEPSGDLSLRTLDTTFE
jgi:hypothetical protein